MLLFEMSMFLHWNGSHRCAVALGVPDVERHRFSVHESRLAATG